MSTRWIVRAGSAAVATIVAVCFASGCGTSKHRGNAKTASPVTAPASSLVSVDPSTAAVSAEILQRYTDMRRLYEAAASKSDYNSDSLKQYLEYPLLQNVTGFLLQNSNHGAVYRGAAVSNPKVAQVHLTATPKTALIEDCYDSTNHILVYKASGSPVPVPSGSRRYIMTTTVTFFDGRGWLFTDSQNYKDRSC